MNAAATAAFARVRLRLCRACGTQRPSSEFPSTKMLCERCIDLRECDRCAQWLPLASFKRTGTICLACKEARLAPVSAARARKSHETLPRAKAIWLCDVVRCEFAVVEAGKCAKHRRANGDGR